LPQRRLTGEVSDQGSVHRANTGTTILERYSGKTGVANIDMSLDTLTSLASSTKLFTSIAAMQCVERGLIGLDDDISLVLPEFARPKLLSGWSNSEEPIIVDIEQRITLRYYLL
jgi:CubicO group peptidase (beta-lactamase class C family)